MQRNTHKSYGVRPEVLETVRRAALTHDDAARFFVAVPTVALAIGLIVGEVLQPGRGFNIDPATIDPKSVATYVTQAKEQGIVAHLMAIIPDSYFGAIARGDLLQVLLVSILSGFAIAYLGK